MLKPLIAGTALVGSLLMAPAMAQSQEELVTRKEKKLAGAWLQNASWVVDYDEAKAQSAASGKPIFAYFTRSYAP